jgi:hypothetical protein
MSICSRQLLGARACAGWTHDDDPREGGHHHEDRRGERQEVSSSRSCITRPPCPARGSVAVLRLTDGTAFLGPRRPTAAREAQRPSQDRQNEVSTGLLMAESAGVFFGCALIRVARPASEAQVLSLRRTGYGVVKRLRIGLPGAADRRPSRASSSVSVSAGHRVPVTRRRSRCPARRAQDARLGARYGWRGHGSSALVGLRAVLCLTSGSPRARPA